MFGRRPPKLRGGRGALTDAEGRYTLDGLPAGRYTIRASKIGFVTVAFGQRRPLQPGTPVDVRDDETLKGVNLQLPRGSVITGHLVDEDGEPMVGVDVRVLRHAYRQGERRLISTARDVSDDRGLFRVFGLEPGTYYVSATARAAGGRGRLRRGVARGGEIEESTGYAPTYYPGVTSMNEAVPVTVGIGEEVTNVSFPVQLVSTVRVSGIVLSSDGQPASPASVLLTPDDNSQFFPGAALVARTGRDGTFDVINVPPGRYVATAQTGGRRFDRRLSARQTITVAGQELPGLTLMLTPGARVTGTIVFESGTALPPSDVTRVRVSRPLPSAAPPVPASTRMAASSSRTCPSAPAGSPSMHRPGGR